MNKKNAGTKLANNVVKVATAALKLEANSNSCLVLYQPKRPEEIKRFKK